MILDVDAPSSWPADLKGLLDEFQAEYPFIVELDSSESFLIPDLVRFRILDDLDGISLAVYHATNLMDHEINEILIHGLSPLSGSMLLKRLADALSQHCITKDFYNFLLRNGLASADAPNRAGRVWVFTSRGRLVRASDFWRLLTFWGGEALRDNFSYPGFEHEALAALGQPAIVQGFVELGLLSSEQRDSFDLVFNLFKVNGNRSVFEQKGGVFSVEYLPPENISKIITKRLEPHEWASINPASI